MLGAVTRAFITKGLGALCSVAVTLLLAAYLQPDGLGYYYLTLSIAQIVAILGSLGLAGAVVPKVEARKAAGGDTAAVVGAALGLTTVLASVAALAGFGMALALPAFAARPLLLAGVLAWLAAMALFELVLAQLFRTRDAFILAALMQNGQARTILLALCLIVLLFGFDVAEGSRLETVLVLFAACAGLPVVAAVALARIPLPGLGSLRREAPALIATGLSALPSTVVTLGLPHLLVILLTWIAGPAATAVFGVAQRIAAVAALWKMSFTLTFVRVVRFYKAGDLDATKAEFTRYAIIAVAGTALTIAGYLVAGAPLMGVLAPALDAVDVNTTVLILMLGHMAWAGFGFSAIFLRNMGEYGPVTLSTVLSGGAALAAMALLAAPLGAYGAAVALALQSIVFNLTTTGHLRRTRGFPEFGLGHVRTEALRLMRDLSRLRMDR